MKNLVPELRADKNGRQTTRWVTPENTASDARCKLPSPPVATPGIITSVKDNRATALAGVAQRGNAWVDDKVEIEAAFKASNAELLAIFANVAYSDHRLRAVKRVYELLEQYACKNILETLTVENLDRYNMFANRLDQRAATRGELRVRSLRVFYLEANREDQLIIERIVDERRTTELFEIKRLIPEFKNIESALSSGVL
jgi:hypothetical protein